MTFTGRAEAQVAALLTTPLYQKVLTLITQNFLDQYSKQLNCLRVQASGFILDLNLLLQKSN